MLYCRVGEDFLRNPVCIQRPTEYFDTGLARLPGTLMALDGILRMCAALCLLYGVLSCAIVYRTVLYCIFLQSACCTAYVPPQDMLVLTHQRAKVALRMDQPLAALQLYSSAAEKHPGDTGLLLGQARIQEAVGQHAHALALYQQVHKRGLSWQLSKICMCKILTIQT